MNFEKILICVSLILGLINPPKEEIKLNLQTEVNIPILMYHHIDENAETGMVVTPTNFESHLKALNENGYTPIFLEDIVEFTEGRKFLPPKPICITFDDGYLSNYNIAYPLLQKYNSKATIAIVGSTIGATHYKDTSVEIIPHFTIEQAKEMENSGIVSIISHTYDMHQSTELEHQKNIRNTICKLKNETEEEFSKYLQNDFEKISSLIRENLGKETIVVAYPLGKSDESSEKILKSLGVKLTVSTTPGMNKIKVGDKIDSLYGLKRYTVIEEINAEKLIKMIEN